MTRNAEHPPQIALARVPYARVLAVCCPVVLALIVIAFVLYMTGLLPSLLPVADLPSLWAQGAGATLDVAGLETGWAWLPHWHRGDILCLASLALLAMGTPLACLAATIQYLRRREYVLSIIAFVQVLILLAAMSGLIVVHS
jgi:hypothetical protein